MKLNCKKYIYNYKAILKATPMKKKKNNTTVNTEMMKNKIPEKIFKS